MTSVLINLSPLGVKCAVYLKLSFSFRCMPFCTYPTNHPEMGLSTFPSPAMVLLDQNHGPESSSWAPQSLDKPEKARAQHQREAHSHPHPALPAPGSCLFIPQHSLGGSDGDTAKLIHGSKSIFILSSASLSHFCNLDNYLGSHFLPQGPNPSSLNGVWILKLQYTLHFPRQVDGKCLGTACTH